MTRTAGLFSISRESEVEPYWPGIWIHSQREGQRGAKADGAYLAVRSNRMGHDFRVRDISTDEFGWWTFGMSFSPDGMVHYYASPGVDELSEADYISSQFPYGYQARQFRTYFFDVCNRNDGRTWSTPWVIDDPKLYLVDARRMASIVDQKEQRIRMAERNAQAHGKASCGDGSRGRRAAAIPASGDSADLGSWTR